MRSIRICLTISPRYIPLVIFSYLFGDEGIGPVRAEKCSLRMPVALQALSAVVKETQYREQGEVGEVGLRASWEPRAASHIPLHGMSLYCKHRL